MRELTDKIFTKFIENSKNPVLVDFYTPTCRPCKLLTPLLESLSDELDQVTFVKVNAAEAGDASDEYNITSVPTLILFYNGVSIARRDGLSSKKVLKKWIEEEIK